MRGTTIQAHAVGGTRCGDIEDQRTTGRGWGGGGGGYIHRRLSVLENAGGRRISREKRALVQGHRERRINERAVRKLAKHAYLKFTVVREEPLHISVGISGYMCTVRYSVNY